MNSIESDEFVLEFRDSSDDEGQSTIKRKKFNLAEEQIDSPLIILGPGCGNNILTFLNPEDRQKFKTQSPDKNKNENYAIQFTERPRKVFSGPRRPKLESRTENLSSFTDESYAEGPVIGMAHSMHSSQSTTPTDQTSLDGDASCHSSTSTSIYQNSDSNIFSMLREGFQNEESQSSPFLYSNTLALFASASASCEANEQDFNNQTILQVDKNCTDYRRYRVLNNIASRKSRAKLQIKMSKTEERNQELRNENKALVKHVEQLASELRIKLPPVLKEFSNIDDEIDSEFQYYRVGMYSDDKLCSTPGPPVFVQTAKETINVTKEMQSEKRRRVLNAAAVKRSRIRNREKEARKTQQNTEIYNTNTSLQTLIDKLYEFRNSKK